MRRLTHHQYTRISMLEDIVTETWPDAEPNRYGVFVDAWKPSSDGAVRVAIIDGQALYGSVDGLWYSREVAVYEIEDDGRVTAEAFDVKCDASGYSTMQEIAAALAAGKD